MAGRSRCWRSRSDENRGIRRRVAVRTSRERRHACDSPEEDQIFGYLTQAVFLPFGTVSMIEIIATSTMNRLKASAMMAASRIATLF